MDSRFLYFPSYLTTYGHLSQEQVELFSVNPPDTHACTNITILDDDVVEQLTQKSFTVHFTSESLSYDRLELPSEGVTITVQDDDGMNSYMCIHIHILPFVCVWEKNLKSM